MNIKRNVVKLVLGSITFLVLATMYASPASATRYAVAFGDGFVDCGTTPGNPCPKN